MRGSHICWAVAALCLLLCGCTLPIKDAAGAPTVSVDWQAMFGSLNWQTVALVVLAYLANSQGHLAAVATAVKKVLQSLKILPAEGSGVAGRSDRIAQLIAQLLIEFRDQPQMQARILQVQAESIVTEVPASASK